jgi:hypothetical protein
MSGGRCSSLIISGHRLDYIARGQLEFRENSRAFRLTFTENRLGFGSWPLLVMWFGGAIQVYIDVYA